MTYPISGVILAGGLNTRFGGQNKAFITFEGRRLIDRIHALFRGFFDEIVVVTNQPLLYLQLDAKIVTDVFPIRCSLTGIHAGLFYASHPFAFITACDTPFLQKAVIETILDAVGEGADVVIPHVEAGFEPLCAAYSKRCLQPIENQLRRGELRISRFFRKMRVKTISETRLKKLDPELKTFFNINAPADLATAQAAGVGLCETSE